MIWSFFWPPWAKGRLRTIPASPQPAGAALRPPRDWRAGANRRSAGASASLPARREALLAVLAGRSVFDIEELHTLDVLSPAPLAIGDRDGRLGLAGAGVAAAVVQSAGRILPPPRPRFHPPGRMPPEEHRPRFAGTGRPGLSHANRRRQRAARRRPEEPGGHPGNGGRSRGTSARRPQAI